MFHRERETERERDRQTEGERQTDRQRERDRKTDRQRANNIISTVRRCKLQSSEYPT